MNAAVHEAVIANDNNSNLAVDGTWHKRGYSSLNGVVCATSVENGKVIDFEALTKYCSSCKEVDSIQHYYGLAIRKNLSSVEDVKRAIWAIYFHKLSTEDNPQHALCPLGEDSCEFLKQFLLALKFGVMDAVICFNDGYVSRIKVFEALGIKSGYNTERALLIIDNKRIFEAERIVNKVSLEARNKRRSLKRKMDKQNLDEENEYQSGKY
ncbi:uncharacterized protein TNCV_450061 [Trichonephila clavipes]|nr:uncharacterized protein TNCV_450061 [Trichonephila clavipes]